MDYEGQQRALALLAAAREHVKREHDRAEAKHDNYGDYYMDSGMYEIMQTAEELMAEIDQLISVVKEQGR